MITSTRRFAQLVLFCAALVAVAGFDLPGAAGSCHAAELLSDPGFEASSPETAQWGWRRNGEAGGITVAENGAHGGRRYLQLRIPQGRTEAAVYQSVRGLDLSRDYTFSVWARGTGKLLLMAYQYALSARDNAFVATDMAQFKMGRQSVVNLPSLHQVFPLTPEWQRYEFRFTPDKKAAGLAVACHVQGGTGDLDDASLVLTGEAADELSTALRFPQLEGCRFDGGALRPIVTTVQGAADCALVVEAEQAAELSLDTRGGVRPLPGASGGLGIDFSTGLTFRLVLTRPGNYRAWYRLSIPFAANWCHSEVMDADRRAQTDLFPTDPLPPDTWGWRPGPVYTLAAGEHTWHFENWHGGIRLDQAALLPDEQKAPVDGTPLPATNVRIPHRAVASSAPAAVSTVREWRRLAAAAFPAGRTFPADFSVDGGRTWTALPADGSLSTLPSGAVPDLRIRCRLLPAESAAERAAAEVPLLLSPRLVYAPEPMQDLTLRGDQLSLQLAGTGGGLNRLRNEKLKVDFDLPTGQGQPLFALTVRNLEPPFTLDTLTALDGQLLKAETRRGRRGGQTFEFRYALLGGAVTVSGTLETGKDEIVRGRIKVGNDGPNEIVAVDFPLLGNLAIQGNAADDILVVPNVQGSKIAHPAGQRFNSPRYWTYPGWLSMGYVDLYDPQARAGLFLATFDPTFTTTQFLFDGSVDGSAFSMGLRKWIRVRQGGSYESPDAVFALHPGDWHWAADRYREWAMTWFHDSTPRWFRESDGYVAGGPLWHGPFDTSLLKSASQAPALDCGLVATWGHMATINGACGLYTYPAPWYGGVNNFRWANRKIQELGGHSNYYIQGHLYNAAYNRDLGFVGNLPKCYFPPEDWKLLPDKAFYSRVRSVEPSGATSPPDIHAEQMCDSAKQEFNDFLCDWTLRFIRDYGTDGMYFDGFAIGPAIPGINYDDEQSTTGDWARGQIRMLRRCKEQGRKINPDVVFGMEGCSDVYQQYGDWGLMSSQNAMEVFRYTFPDLIVIGGSSNGKPETAIEQVFMNGYRMNEMLHFAQNDPAFKSRYYDFLRPWAGRVAAIRGWINPFLLRARFMDTVGVQHADAGVDARLMLRNESANRGALVLLHNLGEAAGKSVTVDTTGWGPITVAWRVTWRGIEPLATTADGALCRFELPADLYSAALLIHQVEPLVDKRLFPLGLPAGEEVSGPVRVLNVNARPLAVTLQVDGPRGFGGDKVRLAVPSGQAATATVACRAPVKAELLKRTDLLLKIGWNGGKTDWLLPARIVGPLDARLARTGDRELTLSIRNRTSRPVAGEFQVAMERGQLPLTPSPGRFAVSAKGETQVKIVADLMTLTSFDNAVTRLTFPGGAEEAYACVGPYVMNADFELSNFGLPVPLADGGWEYDRLFSENGGKFERFDGFPRIVYEGAYRGKGCLLVPKGAKLAHITWNAWLVPNKQYKIRVAIKRTTPEGGGFAMSQAGDVCQSPWLGNTKTPKLNEWELFEGTFKTIDIASNWQVSFNGSATGDIYYDALDIEEVK